MCLPTPFRSKKTIFMAFLFFFVMGGAFAQQEVSTEKEALPVTPPAQENTLVPRPGKGPAAAPSPSPDMAPFRPGLRFGMNAGTMFAGRFGAASYLEPTAYYDLSSRFRVFGSMTYARVMTPSHMLGAEPIPSYSTGNIGLAVQNQMLMQVGGQYDASERLTLTGSAWRDLSNLSSSSSYQPYRSVMGFGGSGMAVRADLRISDNVSISGGFRYGNGNQGTMLNPMFLPNFPFGF
jgi:hypothetical protein